MACFSVFGVISAYVAGKFGDKVGHEISIIVGYLFILIAATIFFLFSPNWIADHNALWLKYIYASIFGSGYSTFVTALWSLVGSFSATASFSVMNFVTALVTTVFLTFSPFIPNYKIVILIYLIVLLVTLFIFCLCKYLYLHTIHHDVEDNEILMDTFSPQDGKEFSDEEFDHEKIVENYSEISGMKQRMRTNSGNINK